MMKKVIFGLLIGTVALSVSLTILETIFHKPILSYLSLGILVGGIFLVAVTILIYIYVKARKRADELEREEKEKEEKRFVGEGEKPAGDRKSALPKVKTGLEESIESLAKTIHMRRQSPRKVRIGGIILGGSLVILIFAALILFQFGQNTAAICCAGAFAGIIICAVLFVVIGQRR